MINFDHYFEFSKKFEDVLSKMKEDGEIFNTTSFGKMEELVKKWLQECDGNIGDDDLRVMTSYLLANVLKPEAYFKELRFLHEEIRLRELVKDFGAISPLFDLMVYASHYVLGDPKKGLTNEEFLQGMIDSVGDSIKKDTFHNLFANIKAKNYNNPELKSFLDGLKNNAKLLK